MLMLMLMMMMLLLMLMMLMMMCLLLCLLVATGAWRALLRPSDLLLGLRLETAAAGHKLRRSTRQPDHPLIIPHRLPFRPCRSLALRPLRPCADPYHRQHRRSKGSAQQGGVQPRGGTYRERVRARAPSRRRLE